MDRYVVQLIVLTLCSWTLVRSQSSEPRITYNLLEEQPANTYVGNIPQDIELTQFYPPSTVATFNYGILTGRYKEFFTIEEATGVLKTSSSLLDRESLCAFKATCIISLDIGVIKPIDYFQVLSIAINVEDRNDNPPRFPKPSLQINISENAAPGSEFVIPTAVDMDTGDNSVQGYEFISNTSRFELKVTKNADETTDLRLMLKDRLDRELVSAYSLKVIAKDGGEPPKMGAIDIQVKVVDSNDNSPVFNRDIYNITLEEDFPLNTPFVQVHAYDLDEGPNGQVTYALATQTLVQYGSIFDVNRTTGQVTLTAPLDYEQETSYTLLVEASDQGPDSLPAHAKIVIRLLDVNDHEPRITINALTDSGDPQISEWAEIGTFVAHVSVEDLDRGPSGEVSCVLLENSDDIEGSRHLALQPIYSPQQQRTNQYKLVTAATLDYERRHTYTVRILCRDGGVPESLEAIRTLTVAVLDANDHAPIFHQSVYHVDLRENGTRGEVLLQLAATDGDHGENQRIYYHLDTTDHHADAKVSVDRDSGTIQTRTIFDHEQMDSFVFRVIASDGGVPSLSATATVSITIIDINDEAPTFDEPVYNFGTFENQDIDTNIGIIMASDLDSPPYNEFTMYLHPDSDALDTFSLDPRKGILKTKKVLDREHQASYTLTVVAANTEFPQLSSSVKVTVLVADKNDNAPKIEFPVPYNDSVVVSAQAPPGYAFTRILASDADAGENARLVYQIAKGNDEQLFAINPTTGALSVYGDLQKSSRNEFTLVILVKDQGGNSPELTSKSAVASLDIQIDRDSAFLATGSGQTGGLILGYHQKIIIILGSVTVFLVIVLLAAIIILKCRQTSSSSSAGSDKQGYQYACRIDLAHKLCNSDDAASDAADSSASDGSTKPPKKSVSFDDHQAARDPNLYVANMGPNKSHLTLEDLQRVRCLYRESPPPPPSATMNTSFEQGQSQGHQPRGQGQQPANQEMEVAQLLELIKRDPSDPDSASAASNADSGRGTSESGDHKNAADLSYPSADNSTEHPTRQRSQAPVKGRQGHPPHHHHHNPSPSPQDDAPPPRPPKQQFAAPNTGCHGNVAARTSSFTGAPLTARAPCKVHPPPKYSSVVKKPTLQDYYPPRTILPPGNARHNYVLDAESADNVSDGGSTTSGSYIVDMDNNGALKAVDV